MSGFRLLLATALIAATACASGHEAMHGTVAMKVSDTEAHVCLLADEAPVGAQVQLSRTTCWSQNGKAYRCHKQAIAVGTVEARMSDHYARVTFPKGTDYKEGDLVEPMH